MYSPPFDTGFSAFMMTELAWREFEPVLFAYLDFGGQGILKLHTHTGQITIGSDVFEGVGSLSYVDLALESDADDISEIELGLVGLPGSFTGLIGQQANLAGNQGSLAMGLMNNSTKVITNNPTYIFAGVIDGRRFKFTRSDDGNSLDVVMRLSTTQSPSRVVSSRRKPSDGSAWRFLSDFGGEDPVWPK